MLLQTEEAAQEKKKQSTGPEEPVPDHQSDHDDEWKVSDDEVAEAYKKQAATSENLLLTVRTIDGDGSEERGAGSDVKPTQHIWQNINEPLKQSMEVKEEQPKEDTSKVWVPKFKSSGRSSLITKDDVDLAEAARILAAKHETPASKKTKKEKKKPAAVEVPSDERDFSQLTKVQFNIFTLIDEKYQSFDQPEKPASPDAEKVKEKYIAKPVFSEAA